MVLWKSRTTPICIPAELHDKLAQTSRPIDQVDSEVIAVRSVPRQDLKDHDDDPSYPPFLGTGA